MGICKILQVIVCLCVTNSLTFQSKSKTEDCQRCKVLVDSFNEWLDRTSRGKYEGGDTAWEETKLKSYARSEVRLIEVQEGLCSEVRQFQDHCYVLAEEAEQLLEKWWFNEGPNSSDLYTWICVENLKYCCPKSHFGESCLKCPTSVSNDVCGGHGTCDGDGTRKGNGTCECYTGYSGLYCEQCADNFYELNPGSCRPCHESCNGCMGEGPDACLSCKTGWALNSSKCIDVNECIDPMACASNEYCVNQEGNFLCRVCHQSCKTCMGPSSSNCSSCDENKSMWSGFCVDDQEMNEIFKNVVSRTLLYVGLIVITCFVYRHSKILASLVTAMISIYVLIAEKSSNFNILDVVLNINEITFN